MLIAECGQSRQANAVHDRPDEKGWTYWLRRGKRRIEGADGYAQGEEVGRWRQQEVGRSMPEGIGGYNQADDGGNRLYRLRGGGIQDLHYKLGDAGHGRTDEEHQ